MPLNVDGKDAPAAVDVPGDRPSTSAAHRVSFTDQHERRVSQLGAELVATEGEVTAAQRRRSVTQSDDGGKAAADGTTKSERKLKRSSTMTQAKFAARMASKMKHRQEDKRTKAKDRWLVATGVSGLVVLIVHDTILITLPAVYPHVGFFLRAAMTVNCAVLVGQLCADGCAAQFGALLRAILLRLRPAQPSQVRLLLVPARAQEVGDAAEHQELPPEPRPPQPLPRRSDDRRPPPAAHRVPDAAQIILRTIRSALLCAVL